jgi:hypothetical protein
LKRLCASLAIAFLLGLPVFAQIQPVGVYPLNGTGPAIVTPATVGGDTTTSDVPAAARSISGQSALSTNTVNTAGANLNLAGGIGRRKFTVVSNAALATKTITLTANGTLVTLTASAGAPAANQFGPVGTDDTAPQILVTSTALAAAITAHATLGPLMTPSVAAGVVYLTKAPTLNTLTIATGTAGALVTATQGPDGGVVVPSLFTNNGTSVSVGKSGVGGTSGPTSRNTSIGATAGQAIAPTGTVCGGIFTQGTNNTILGDTGQALTTGCLNTLVGVDAGTSFISGAYNTLVGVDAGQLGTAENYVTAIGATAAQHNTGDYVVAIGYQSVYAGNTAANSIGVGNNALGQNTSGTGNVAVGYTALAANTTGSFSTAVGYAALGVANNATADNTAFGYNALHLNDAGFWNTAVGYTALGAVTGGSYNTAVGLNACSALVTTHHNTCIGYATGPASSLTNTTSLGDSAVPTASNQIVFGNASVTSATIPGFALTAGTMTATAPARTQKTLHRYDWTNAMVAALGAVTAGDIAVCTLPAKEVVTNAYVVINTAAGGTTTLTVAVGRTGAAYIDYIVASNAQAAANTVYGDASAERGSNLTGYDLPSFTGTTIVNAHFISTVSNLSAVTTSTGTVYLETMLLP